MASFSKNAKTKIKLLRFDEVRQPYRGGRPGNSNAWKTGAHSAEARALRKRVHSFRQRVKALLARVEKP